MTTDHSSDDRIERSRSEFSEWRQADRFALEAVAFLGDDAQPGSLRTPDGVALVSQSCDVVLPHRQNVQVAPLVRLSGDNSRAARDGKRSQYAHLPQLGDDWFADLDHVSTVSKAALASRRLGPGVASDKDARRFAAAIARRFGRFAFPDDVSDAMKSLRDLVQSRATKSESPFGKILHEVLELRAESRAWTAAASDVTLIFVLKPGALPTLPDDDPGAMPASVSRYQPKTSSAKSQLTEIAQALTGPARWNAFEKYWLWQMLADAAALLCDAQASNANSTASHPTFTGEVVSGDEFALTRVRRSEIVDLDHLSTPFPMDDG